MHTQCRSQHLQLLNMSWIQCDVVIKHCGFFPAPLGGASGEAADDEDGQHDGGLPAPRRQGQLLQDGRHQSSGQQAGPGLCPGWDTQSRKRLVITGRFPLALVNLSADSNDTIRCNWRLIICKYWSHVFPVHIKNIKLLKPNLNKCQTVLQIDSNKFYMLHMILWGFFVSFLKWKLKYCTEICVWSNISSLWQKINSRISCLTLTEKIW